MKRILPIILAVIALAAAIFGTRYWQQNYLAGISTTKIPVPRTDIPPYTPLSVDMFVLQDTPRALLDQGAYIASASEIEGSISVETLLSGLPVAKRMAVPASQFRLADPSLEVISLPAEAAGTVGGQVHVGEQINLYILLAAEDQANENDPKPKPTVTFVARVPIVAVLASAGEPLITTNDKGETEIRPMSILVVAAPHDTVRIILDAIALMEHEGAKLWVTLATP
jgi:hypothetical protein